MARADGAPFRGPHLFLFPFRWLAYIPAAMWPPRSSAHAPLIMALALLATGCAGPRTAHRPTALRISYAYAFLALRAERVQGEDLQRARALRKRAGRHYMRALEQGLARLERRHPGFTAQLSRNPGEAVAVTTLVDVPLLYWTGAALGTAISVFKDRPEMLIRLPEIGALAFRVTELQPGYLDGAAYELLMLYEAGRPAMMGGSLALAKHYYERALTYSQGNSVSLFVGYGESISVQEQDRETFVRMLERALEVKAGGVANRLARRRARWLLQRADDLFIL